MKKGFLPAVFIGISFVFLTWCLCQAAYADPVISVAPMSVNMGNIPVEVTSAPKTVTISNKGTSDLSLDPIAPVTIKDPNGEDTTEFIIQSNICSSTIPAKGSCTVTVIFTPAKPFGKKNAVMSIVSNDPKKLTLNVKLSGQAPPPKISASPMSVNFGSVSAGSSSIAKTVTIKNTGVSDLKIDPVSIKDTTGEDTTEFSIQSNSCSTIPAKGSCAITVAMNPTSAGSKTALMNISSNDSKKSNIAVKLAGTGLQAPYNPPDDGTTFTMSEYFPLGQGDTWTYREEDNQLTVKTVSGTEKINGVDAVKMIDEDRDYQLWTNSNGIVWYKEYDADDIPGCGWEQKIFSPPVHASDSVVSVGSTYTSNTTLMQTDCTRKSATASFSYEFTIEGIEDITVPAGIFNDCLKIKGIFSLNGGTQTQEMTIWLAEGLGTVKSISIEKENGSIVETWTEDLVSAVVGGVHYH